MNVTATTHISQEVKVSVPIDDLIDAINNLNIRQRYNYIAHLLNGIDLGGVLELDATQRKIIRDYLTGELQRFEEY